MFNRRHIRGIDFECYRTDDHDYMVARTSLFINDVGDMGFCLSDGDSTNYIPVSYMGDDHMQYVDEYRLSPYTLTLNIMFCRTGGRFRTPLSATVYITDMDDLYIGREIIYKNEEEFFDGMRELTNWMRDVNSGCMECKEMYGMMESGIPVGNGVIGGFI